MRLIFIDQGLFELDQLSYALLDPRLRKTMDIIIQRYEDFDVEVANKTIGYHFDEEIVEVRIAGLGEGVGLMSSIARGHLTLSSGEEKTVVIKCTARTENSELSKGLNFYRNEVNFYQHLSDQCPIEVPRCLYACVDSVTQDFLLVLDDLGNETAGDQLTGVSEGHLRAAFTRAGQLHGMFWGKTAEHEWLNYQLDMRTTLFRRDSILRPGIEPTIRNFGEHFSGNREEIVRKIGDQYADLFLKAMSGEQTIIHGDYRVDNSFLVMRNNEPDIISVDWQNTTGGNGTHDIAYFSAQSCNADLRGEIELSCLKQYHETLCDMGVENYSFDQCVEHYRYNLLILMITPIAICGTLDQGNERGARVGAAGLQRTFEAIESLECEQLLA